MSKKTIRVSDATFRAIAAQHGFVVTEPQVKQPARPLQIGDTVRITGPECNGLVGELRVIDEKLEEGYGVQFDEIVGYVFFKGDELSKVDMAELPF